jgi:Bacteriocin-protection, YdeI or OmpD-Associated/Domain of unknown function (DUF1905)
MKFRTRVELGGKTATGFEVPADIVEALGAGKRPRVHVTINGHTYRSTVAVMGGRYLLPLNAENRSAAGVAAGDEIYVVVEPDTQPREVEVPDDFAKALKADAVARQAFERLSYSHKRQHVQAIQAAKKPETRVRRIEKALDMLRSGE